jgi:DNA polymerase-3 subunit delta
MPDPNIYLLHGTDEFAIAIRVNEFVEGMGDPVTAGMNITRLDGRSFTEEELSNAVNSVPFLASKRLVILSNPSSRYSHPGGQKKFTAFLEAVPPTTILLLAEPGVLKENHWLVKWARSTGVKARVETFAKPKQREMPGWIVKETRKQGGKIDSPAAARLTEMVGEDTRQAAQEIVKLLTYLDYKRAIGIEDVEAVSIVAAQGDVFVMVDAIGEGNGKKALKMLHRLLEEEDPFQLFGMIIRQFRLLLLAREAMDSGDGVQKATEALGVAPFVGEKVCKQARGFSLQALEGIYHHLLQIDEDIKTGQITIELALDTLIAGLTERA